MIREFTADLLAHIEFNPESDDEDDGEEETDEDGLEDTDVDGFNVRRFLEDLVSRLEDAAVEQFARDNAERGQCIRQFIEVINIIMEHFTIYIHAYRLYTIHISKRR